MTLPESPSTCCSRRSALRFLGRGSAVLVGLPWIPADAGAVEEAGRELLRDPGFQRGFRLCAPPPGKRVPYGDLRGFVPAAPEWDLDQWSSRFPMSADRAEKAPAEVPPESAGPVRRWTNTAKALALGRRRAGLVADPFDLELTVNASAEYGERARRADEPWVHLLVEQAIDGAPSLAILRRARFRIEARLRASRLHRTDDYSPDRHAAQFQVFLAVQNRNRASPGHGRLVWFGIPLYDDRRRIPPEHKTQDTGGTGMFIFTPPGSTYTRDSAHDGGWVRVDHDLVALLREAVEAAWAKGFLTESRDLADYGITSINLGWEVPGTFDVAMQVRGLSLLVD